MGQGVDCTWAQVNRSAGVVQRPPTGHPQKFARVQQERYCVACAQQIIGNAMAQLQQRLFELDLPRVS